MAVSTHLQSSLLFLQSSFDISASDQRSSPSITFFTNNPRSALRIAPFSSGLRFDHRTVLKRVSDGSELQVEGFVGGGGDEGNKNSGGGGGGGRDNKGEGEGEGESKDKSVKKMAAMSMSQKLTLGYAALVGAGGVMGYLKSGSQKSLAAGGLSALGLLFVYSELPVRPALASAVGLGLSAALLTVMGSRFKKSGKFFPAGLVSIVSFIMAGGYVHGFFRSQHA